MAISSPGEYVRSAISALLARPLSGLVFGFPVGIVHFLPEIVDPVDAVRPALQFGSDAVPENHQLNGFSLLGEVLHHIQQIRVPGGQKQRIVLVLINEGQGGNAHIHALLDFVEHLVREISVLVLTAKLHFLPAFLAIGLVRALLFQTVEFGDDLGTEGRTAAQPVVKVVLGLAGRLGYGIEIVGPPYGAALFQILTQTQITEFVTAAYTVTGVEKITGVDKPEFAFFSHVFSRKFPVQFIFIS